MNFDQFKFHPHIRAGIQSAGYTMPTSIQSQAIQPILDGRDLLGLAQTGTGKTAAFVLPIIQRLLNGPRGKLRALILSPTRELAEQTQDFIKLLGRQAKVRSVTVYGGVSAIPQVKGLRAGAEVVVACPGRLLDLMSQRAISLGSIDMLVLDEADRMFDMGFLPDIRRILAALPRTRQTLLFSATMPDEIRALADNMLHDPVTVEVDAQRPVESIHHAVYPVEAEKKLDLLMKLLPQTHSGQVLIFTRTKHRAKKVAQQLVKAGLSATSLQGNLSQNQRQLAMDGFRRGHIRVLVATDIAARGIDVSEISHVINFDMPDTAESYTHRIGRTGRMSRTGAALTLVTQSDLPMLRTIEKRLGYSIEQRKVEGYEVELKMPAHLVVKAKSPSLHSWSPPKSRVAFTHSPRRWR